MSKRGTFHMFAGLILATNLSATAQTLIDPTSAPRAMGVSQFGLPRDAKFIFCSGEDCPQRTTKTMATPKPAALVVAASRPVVPALLPQLQSIQPPAELSCAKVDPVKKIQKPVVRKKKRSAQLRCGPGDTKK